MAKDDPIVLDPRKVLKVELVTSLIGTFYTRGPNWEATPETKEKVLRLAFEMVDKIMAQAGL